MLDQDIDVDGLASELDIKSKAIRQGQMNQPPANATDFDVPQRDIVQRMTEMLEQARRETEEALTRHKTRRDEIEREMSGLRLEDVPKDAEVAIKRAEHDQTKALVEARQQERRMMRELRAFKAANDLMHEPAYPDSFILHWAVIAGIILVESIANSYFFAKGSDLGLLGGLFQALLISVVNVVPAMIVGSRVLPYLHHVNGNNRMAAGIGLAVFGVVLCLFNLAVAHYRAVLESDPIMAIVQAIPNLIRSPFGIDNLDAWVLFSLGSAFAVMAVLKGYSADDRYPGYGRLHRAYKAVEAVYLDLRQEILDIINAVIDSHRGRIEQMIATGQSNVREYGDLIARSKAAAVEFDRRAQALEGACNLMLKSYRTQNSEIRTDPVPAYWDKAYTFGKLAECVPPDLGEEHRNLEAFDQQVKGMRGDAGKTIQDLRHLNEQKLTQSKDFFAFIEAEADAGLAADAPAAVPTGQGVADVMV